MFSSLSLSAAIRRSARARPGADPAGPGVVHFLQALEEVPVPEGPIIVGIDGAYLRNWHDKQKKFEVIVGKSVPEVRDHRYLVQTHDDKPERRLFEVLRSQDLRMNLTFLTDGGDSSFLDGISPCAETYLDWFHITMRLTVLSQYTKGLAHRTPVEALAPQPAGADQVAALAWRHRRGAEPRPGT